MPRSKPSRSSRIHNKAPSSSAIENVDDIELDEPAQASTSAAAIEANDAVRTLEYQTAVNARNKRELALAQKVKEREANKQPYSRSHRKRLNRKEKSALTANLGEVDQALDEVALPINQVVVNEMTIGEAAEERALGKKTKKVPVAAVSTAQAEKKEKLTAKKRQKVLAEANSRLVPLLNHKDFVANPFAAIRQHAANTLVAHRPDRRPSNKKQ